MKLLAVETIACCLVLFATGARSTEASEWQRGDVFVGVSNGSYKVYDNSGNYKETISDGLNGFTDGCAFDSAGDLYTTDASSNRVLKYLHLDPHPIVLNFVANGPTTADVGARSLEFDANGNICVGHDCDHYSPITGQCNSIASIHEYDVDANYGEHRAPRERPGFRLSCGRRKP